MMLHWGGRLMPRYNSGLAVVARELAKMSFGVWGWTSAFCCCGPKRWVWMCEGGSRVVVGGSVGRDRVKEIQLQWNYTPNWGFTVSKEVSNVDLEDSREDLHGRWTVVKETVSAIEISGGAGGGGAAWAESAMAKGDWSSSSSATETAVDRVPEY